MEIDAQVFFEHFCLHTNWTLGYFHLCAHLSSKQNRVPKEEKSQGESKQLREIQFPKTK